ncbi:MAG: class I SAM-dependent methyltransferase [Rhizobiales bacterium]|nr:class I SAM-dependent methyltransferase [Hyphomicrobiales bacterium]
MSGPSDHWQTYHRRWSGLEAPLRPNSEIRARIVDLVGSGSDRVLLLGVTPELALSFENVVAVDKSAAMIANIWPGDGAKRRAIQADWLELDGSLGRFTAAIGDGSGNVLSHPGEIRQLLLTVREHLEPGGRFVCRLYARPEKPWSWQELLDEAAGRATVNFHAFKWKIAMRIAADGGAAVPVTRIHEQFERHFPDREKLAAVTGWDRSVIDMIDTYRGSSAVYCFPTRAEFLDCLPSGFRGIGFHPSGTYDLAEDCPIFACEKA